MKRRASNTGLSRQDKAGYVSDISRIYTSVLLLLVVHSSYWNHSVNCKGRLHMCETFTESFRVTFKLAYPASITHIRV